MADDPGKAAERENILLQRILQVSLAPAKDCVVLPGLAGELKDEGRGAFLAVDIIDRCLIERLSVDGTTAAQLGYLGQCFNRCNDSGLVPTAMREKAVAVQGMVVNYVALAVQCPEMFGAANDGDPGGAVFKAIEEQKLGTLLLSKLADRLAEEDMGMFNTVMSSVLTKLIIGMAGRDLQEMKVRETAIFASLLSRTSKGSPVIPLIVKLPVFRPRGLPGQAQAGEGFRLQTESLLGFLLSPSPQDNHVNPSRVQSSAKAVHFTGLQRKTRPALNASLSQIRQQLTGIQEQALAVVNTLVRGGDAPRQAVLEWFGAVMTGTESRSKMSNQLGHPGQIIDMMEHAQNPMMASLPNRLSMMQGLQARMLGFATSGFATNVLWTLLELVKPVKLFSGLDPFFGCRTDVEPLLGGFLKEERFVDKDGVEEALQSPQAKAALAAAPGFKHQIFWAALKGLHTLLIPPLKEAECFIRCASHFQLKGDMAKFEEFFGEWLSNDVVLSCPQFLGLLGSMMSLTLSVYLGAAYPDLLKKASPTDAPSVPFASMIVPAPTVTPEWSVLPACILDDIIEILEFYQRTVPPGQPPSEIFMHIDPNLLLYAVIFILGSGDHIRNPNIRGKAAQVLRALSKMPSFSGLITSHPCCVQNIVPSCIRVFTAVEKTKMSFFDIRMHVKFELRIPIMELFEDALALKEHREVLKNFASNHAEEFLKFANQLMNDSTHLLDEGMDSLLEVRGHVKRAAGATGASSSQANVEPQSQAAQSGAVRGEDLVEDERNDQGEDIYRQSRHDPKEHCKRYMQMGHRTIRTLWNIARDVPSVLVSDPVVLTQMLQSCLNATMDRLVGPKCLQLKNQSGVKDFDEFNFNPKDLLSYVVEMYVCIARECKDRAIRIISEDDRNYSAETFRKAVKISRRENVVTNDVAKDFEQFVAILNETAKATKEALDNVEIPDEFLDPIMQEMMMDPVKLPTSGNIMDRKHIHRIIMADDADPFNRMPLKLDMLVPQTELKEKIRTFCQQNHLPWDDS
mmetsp:Transcript_12882/g.29236  ORF Transcript_12882/g.29236 Transcript_12882/m.29236 type:complete len:1022 (+) Transcript_12882:65-3130(+)